MKLNKNILVSFIVVIGSTFLFNYSFNRPTIINKYIATHLYGAPANTAFTDDNFYKCVIDNYNLQNNLNLAYTDSLTDEQLHSITGLYCESYEIENPIGLEKLTELISLSLTNNSLTELDLSNNIKLESFNAKTNNLSNINFGDISSLKYIYLENNSLTEIDLSKLSNLIHFRADNNDLQSVNLNNNTNLTYLSIDDNNLTELNIDDLVNLQTLYASDNLINQINFKNNNSLKDVRISDNNIENLEIANKPNLTYLDIDNNKLKTVKIINNSALSNISLNNNEINNLIVENNDLLTQLSANQNNLQNLDLSKNTNLKKVYAYQSGLASINVDNLEKLETLTVWNNNLQNINLEDNINLTTLGVSNNELESINLTNNTNLTDVNLDGNSFKTITLSDKNYELALSSIVDSKNYIAKLDIGNSKIIQPTEELKLYINNKIVVPSNSLVEDFINKLQLQNLTAIVYDKENNITNDTIKNGYYLKIYNGEEVLQNLLIETFENPYFDDVNFYKCVVDAYNLSNTPNKSYDDVLTLEEIKKITRISCETDNKIMSVKGIELLENLNYLYLPDNNISHIDLSNNTKLEFLNLQKNDLSEIHLNNLIHLTDAWLDSNFLTEIDLSNNTSLKKLSLPYNDLIELDLSNNIDLEIIDLVGNELTELDLSNNPNLINVDINNNYQSNLIIYKDDLVNLNNYSPVKFVEGKESIIQEPIINYDEIKYEDNNITINKSGIYFFKIQFQPNVSGVASLYSVDYNINVIDIESELYLIQDNNIYIGTETDNKTIIDNIKVNGFIDGISTTIEDKKLVIKNNDEVLKKFKLLNIYINELNVQQKNIILNEEMTFENFTNKITLSEGLTYKIFNGETEITEGNISKGMALKVFYNNEIIDTYEITDEYLDLSLLNVDEDKELIKVLGLGTKVGEFKDKIYTSGSIIIVDKNNEVLTDDKLIASGTKVKIELTIETYEYTLSVKGDVSGDGKATVADFSKAYQYYKGRIEMDDCYIEASDVVKNDSIITMADVSKIYQFIKNRISSLD